MAIGSALGWRGDDHRVGRRNRMAGSPDSQTLLLAHLQRPTAMHCYKTLPHTDSPPPNGLSITHADGLNRLANIDSVAVWIRKNKAAQSVVSIPQSLDDSHVFSLANGVER